MYLRTTTPYIAIAINASTTPVMTAFRRCFSILCLVPVPT